MNQDTANAPQARLIAGLNNVSSLSFLTLLFSKRGYFRSSRAMTTRWIWLVPSKIWVSLASRIMRSTG